MDIAGRSMLARVIERTAAAPGVDKVLVATSTNPLDDAIAEFARGKDSLASAETKWMC